MSDYSKIYNQYQSTLDDCKVISKKMAGISAPSSAHFYSSLIITKLCTSGVTLQTICPSPQEIGQAAHWD